MDADVLVGETLTTSDAELVGDVIHGDGSALAWGDDDFCALYNRGDIQTFTDPHCPATTDDTPRLLAGGTYQMFSSSGGTMNGTTAGDGATALDWFDAINQAAAGWASVITGRSNPVPNSAVTVTTGAQGGAVAISQQGLLLAALGIVALVIVFKK